MPAFPFVDTAQDTNLPTPSTASNAARFQLLRSTRARLYLGLCVGTVLTFWFLSAGGDTSALLGVATLTALYAMWMVGYLYFTDEPRHPDAPASIFDPLAHPRYGVLNTIPVTWRQAAVTLASCVAIVAVSAFLLQLQPSANGWLEQADVDWSVVMAAAFLVMSASLLPIELLGIPVVRRWGTSPPPRALAAWLLGSGIIGSLCGALVAELFAPRLASLSEFSSSSEWLGWLSPAVVTCLCLFVWIRHGSVSAWQARLDAQTQRAEAAEQARRLAEAQLAMMQAQIEPHFLYNTLASLQYLVRSNGAAADFLLTQLIRYLRSAMPKLRAPVSTLGQEFELSDAYLQIARMRMGARLTVSVELAESLHEMPFPPLVLQTLVENALQHGVEPKVGPVSITVRAALQDGQLEVLVEDDGVGLGRGPGLAPTAGSGAGLANIRARLASIYAGAAKLEVTERLTGGATSMVSVLLPAVDPSAPASPAASGPTAPTVNSTEVP